VAQWHHIDWKGVAEMSEDETRREQELLAETVAAAGKLGAGFAMGLNLAAEGSLGETAAALGEEMAPAAELVGAFGLGYEAGSILEDKTHIGEKMGDAVYDAVHSPTIFTEAMEQQRAEEAALQPPAIDIRTDESIGPATEVSYEQAPTS
jgi:hypothetical protein